MTSINPWTLADTMKRMVERAKREAYEDAAKIAEGHLTRWHENTALYREIANAIRARIAEE